jgi:transketolase
MKVYVPFDPSQVVQILEHAYREGGPSYLRLGRNPVPSIVNQDIGFNPQGPVRMARGEHLTMVACGIPSFMAYEAMIELREMGITVDLFLVTTLKPFQGDGIVQSLQKTGRLVTIEEHNLYGGLRSAVLEHLSGKLDLQTDHVAIEDSYGATGPYMELLAEYGISTRHIIQKSTQLVQQ